MGIETYQLQTGKLFVTADETGKYETLSIGDYGKQKNVKADFLGYTRELEGVPNGPCMPLSDKWVMTLSTQYGCPMKCKFCDVPKVGYKGNIAVDGLFNQLCAARRCFPDVKYTDRLNIHFARMGEPTFNPDVLTFSVWLSSLEGKSWFQEMLDLRVETIHPVLSTMLPKSNKKLTSTLVQWCKIKNNFFRGQAGLQLSINSTNKRQRDDMFREKQISLNDIATLADELPIPLGRKYCLNFAYATGYEIDAEKLDKLFNKDKFMVKITPIHNNISCKVNEIVTVGGYDSWAPYNQAEKDLKELGWDVLVFVPSMNEESDLITCGNSILSRQGE